MSRLADSAMAFSKCFAISKGSATLSAERGRNSNENLLSSCRRRFYGISMNFPWFSMVFYGFSTVFYGFSMNIHKLGWIRKRTEHECSVANEDRIRHVSLQGSSFGSLDL